MRHRMDDAGVAIEYLDEHQRLLRELVAQTRRQNRLLICIGWAVADPTHRHQALTVIDVIRQEMDREEEGE